MFSASWPDCVQIPSDQESPPLEPPGAMGSLLIVPADADSGRAVRGFIKVKSTNVLLTFLT